MSFASRAGLLRIANHSLMASGNHESLCLHFFRAVEHERGPHCCPTRLILVDAGGEVIVAIDRLHERARQCQISKQVLRTGVVSGFSHTLSTIVL